MRPATILLAVGAISTLVNPSTAGEVWAVCLPAALISGPAIKWYAKKLSRPLEAERRAAEQLRKLNDDLEARLRAMQ